MSLAPPESSEDPSVHDTEATEESGAPHAHADIPPAPAVPKLSPLELPEFAPPARPMEPSAWPLEVADAAAEFAALRASAPAITADAAEPPVPEALNAELGVSDPQSPDERLQPEVASEAPAARLDADAPVDTYEPRVSYVPFPVALEQRVVTITPATSAEQYEPPPSSWSPEPASIEASEALEQREVVATAVGTSEAEPESDPADDVSVEWDAEPLLSAGRSDESEKVAADSAPAVVQPSAPPETALKDDVPTVDASANSAELGASRGVDWSRNVLGDAARVAAVAAERARADRPQVLADAALVSSQRVAMGLTPQPAPEKTPIEPEPPTALRARSALTPQVLFALAGSVILALGVGFVSGLLVGKETSGSGQVVTSRPVEPALTIAAAEPDSAEPETVPVTRPSGASPSPSPQPRAAAPVGNPASNAAAAPAKFLRGPFDEKAARQALNQAAARAGVCVPPGDAGGDAQVTITLDPSGGTSNAAVYGARFAGTDAGECIAGLLREVKVRPFSGEPVTVKKTIRVN